MQDQQPTKAATHLHPCSFGNLTAIQQLHFKPADHWVNITPAQFEVQTQAPWQHSAHLQAFSLQVGLLLHIVRLKLRENLCLTPNTLRHCISWAFT